MEFLEKITSRDNGRLVAARRVRDGKDKTSIFIEGRRLVEEALRSNIKIDHCFVADTFSSDGLIELIAQTGCKIAGLTSKIFSTIADTNNPQGIIVLGRRPESDRDAISARLSADSLPLVIFLYNINNPSNLGAIIRTAEAADAAGVIISETSADVFSAKSVRASMGSIFRVPVWENADLKSCLTWAQENQLAATAVDICGAKNYGNIDWKPPRLLIFGSEAHGLGQLEMPKDMERVIIPMANRVESLNLAVSAGIILFEAKRQRSLTV